MTLQYVVQFIHLAFEKVKVIVKHHSEYIELKIENTTLCDHIQFILHYYNGVIPCKMNVLKHNPQL